MKTPKNPLQPIFISSLHLSQVDVVRLRESRKLLDHNLRFDRIRNVTNLMSLVMHCRKFLSRWDIADPNDMRIERDRRDPLLAGIGRRHLAHRVVLVRFANKPVLRNNP